MKATFEKMISQLDLVTKTIKIFDQRIQNLEGHITTLANRQKKGFVQKQPPQMGDYQYLMENSGSNYVPNNSIKNNEDYQKFTNLNNMDYYTAEIPNQGGTFNEAMNININDINKKNMYKTEVEVNNQKNGNENQNNEYMGEIHEEYGYNIGDNQQYENEQYVENNGEEQIEQNNEQSGEEYEEMQEEQYDYEEQYEEGNYGEEEQIEQMEEYQGEENGEEGEVVYGYNNENENDNEEMDNNNNEQQNQN